jgi:hypothetical protein
VVVWYVFGFFLLSEQYWGNRPSRESCSLRIPSHKRGRDIHSKIYVNLNIETQEI